MFRRYGSSYSFIGHVLKHNVVKGSVITDDHQLLMVNLLWEPSSHRLKNIFDCGTRKIITKRVYRQRATNNIQILSAKNNKTGGQQDCVDCVEANTLAGLVENRIKLN